MILFGNHSSKQCVQKLNTYIVKSFIFNYGFCLTVCISSVNITVLGKCYLCANSAFCASEKSHCLKYCSTDTSCEAGIDALASASYTFLHQACLLWVFMVTGKNYLKYANQTQLRKQEQEGAHTDPKWTLIPQYHAVSVMFVLCYKLGYLKLCEL